MSAKTVLALAVLASSAYAADINAQLSQAASAAAPGEILSFTVQLRDTLTVKNIPASLTGDRSAQGKFVYNALAAHAKKSQAGIEELLKSLGDQVAYYKSYKVSNSLVVDGTSEVLSQLQNHPDVLSISSNAAFNLAVPKPSGNAPAASLVAAAAPLWNLAQVKAPQVWAKGFLGGNLTYANADTGVTWNHPELRGNYLGVKADGTVNHNYAWYDGVQRAVAPSNPYCSPKSAAPCDDNGHGTHTTSTSVGKTVGVAPGAKWMACRNMDYGTGRPETYLNCLEFFLAPTDLNGENPDASKRPHAIGNSYGCPAEELCDKNTFNTALANLKAAGIFMSVSAGNSYEEEGCNSVSAPPAISSTVTSVAAVDSKNLVASFSSRGNVAGRGTTGRGVDISAPGVNVKGAWRTATGFNTISGTSMASPHVGGAVMLIAEACPKLQRDVAKITSLLYSTATPLYTLRSNGCAGDTRRNTPNTVYGYGQLNIDAAIKKCQAA
ncbi:hypothetical protein PhCBS80983_g01193 [Powellomyces hirtus]|uniref:Peptidase S8/S53 domain-containing protein n=1 Tax=Powellomyces hirtus TaxID=109895 RepID=A0A507ED50_9FUNG|nr:hypothetical protein PhCBS80983_g01193 [Powellomyces hirtus]